MTRFPRVHFQLPLFYWKSHSRLRAVWPGAGIGTRVMMVVSRLRVLHSLLIPTQDENHQQVWTDRPGTL